MRLLLERRPSPVSELLLVTDDNGILRALEFAEHESRMHRLLRAHYGEYTLSDHAAPDSITAALGAYFNGQTRALDQLPVKTGGTSFQQAVWKALRTIPAGETTGYGRLAAQLGRANASRAVGAANGSNPIAIVVPCHRVIGSNGDLTGYAGGLAHKRWLLDHEKRHATITGLPLLAGA